MRQIRYLEDWIIESSVSLLSNTEIQVVNSIGNFINTLFSRIPLKKRKGFILGSSLFEMAHAYLKMTGDIGEFAIWQSCGGSGSPAPYTASSLSRKNDFLYLSQWAAPPLPTATGFGIIINTIYEKSPMSVNCDSINMGFSSIQDMFMFMNELSRVSEQHFVYDDSNLDYIYFLTNLGTIKNMQYSPKAPRFLFKLYKQPYSDIVDAMSNIPILSMLYSLNDNILHEDNNAIEQISIWQFPIFDAKIEDYFFKKERPEEVEVDIGKKFQFLDIDD